MKINLSGLAKGTFLVIVTVTVTVTVTVIVIVIIMVHPLLTPNP